MLTCADAMCMMTHVAAMLQVSRFLEAWLTGTSPVQYTPAGLAWASEWGTLRYTMNAAFIAEVVAKHITSKFLGVPTAILLACLCEMLYHAML